MPPTRVYFYIQTASTTRSKPGELEIEIELAEDPLVRGNVATIPRKILPILYLV
jgi:hypothetical protein